MIEGYAVDQSRSCGDIREWRGSQVVWPVAEGHGDIRLSW